MSNLREAAQQALEALEDIFGANKVDVGAINALRAALAEPVQETEPVAWRWGYRSVTTGEMDWRGYVEIAAHPNLRSPEIIMEPLYTSPPQRPVEPQGCDHCEHPLYAAVKCRVCGRVTEPTPPQRKPLTEEEIFAIENDIPDDVISDRAWTIWFARAIERAHGIKEGT